MSQIHAPLFAPPRDRGFFEQIIRDGEQVRLGILDGGLVRPQEPQIDFLGEVACIALFAKTPTKERL
jgi:hypothetical protein